MADLKFLVLMLLLLPLACECRNRIAQGETAIFNDWKFVVNLRIWFPNFNGASGYDDNRIQVCTGSLLHNQRGTFIVTAGHCFQRDGITDRQTFKKDPALKFEDLKTVLFRGSIDVTYPIEHPKFGFTTLTATFEDETVKIAREAFGFTRPLSELTAGLTYGPMDFALIKVDASCFGSPVFLRNVMPISTNEMFKADCQLAGWGKNGIDKELFEGFGQPAETLQTASLSVIDISIEEYRQSCFSGIRPTNDADLPLCLKWNTKIDKKPRVAGGDSGGPIMCDINGKLQFAGVISTGGYSNYVVCGEDGTEQFSHYEDFSMTAAPISSIYKFIEGQKWKGQRSTGCSLRQVLDCTLGCIWPAHN